VSRNGADQPVAFATAERAALAALYERAAAHKEERAKLEEITHALGRRLSAKEDEIATTQQALAAAEEAEDKRAIDELLGNTVAVALPLEGLRQSVEQARKDLDRIARAFEVARGRRDDPQRYDEADRIERLIRVALADVINAELQEFRRLYKRMMWFRSYLQGLLRRGIPVGDTETIGQDEEWAAYRAAAETIEALRGDAGAELPPIPVLPLFLVNGSLPSQTSSSELFAIAVSPGAAADD
jgi:hypothetical protein